MPKDASDKHRLFYVGLHMSTLEFWVSRWRPGFSRARFLASYANSVHTKEISVTNTSWIFLLIPITFRNPYELFQVLRMRISNIFRTLNKHYIYIPNFFFFLRNVKTYFIFISFEFNTFMIRIDLYNFQ